MDVLGTRVPARRSGARQDRASRIRLEESHRSTPRPRRRGTRCHFLITLKSALSLAPSPLAREAARARVDTTGADPLPLRAMHARRPHLAAALAGALALLALAPACGDDDARSAAPDTALAADARVSDVTDVTDDDADPQGADTVAPPDVDDDASPSDADATATDADASDASACTFFDEPRLVFCHGLWTRVSVWSDGGDPTCGAYWTFGPDRYETLEALAAGVGCDGTCVLAATVAVDFIDCDGHRNGYEVYEAADDCGGPAYGTADGVYTDLCLWPLRSCSCEDR